MSIAPLVVVIDFTGESVYLSDSIQNPPRHWLDVSKPNLVYRNRFAESLAESSNYDANHTDNTNTIKVGGGVSVIAIRPHMLYVSH